MSGKKLVTFLFASGLIYITYKSFVINGAKTIVEMATKKSALENVYYIIQIIVGISMVIGALVAVWQYVLTARSERMKINNDRVEKAVKLSGYYKDNILDGIVVLREVFKESGIKEILDRKIQPKEMKAFDKAELDNMLSETDINDINNRLRSKETVEKIEKVKKWNPFVARYLKCMNITEAVRENSSVSGQNLMSKIVNDLLNDMEYFSMHFTHGVADESVVYQSLHQTYVECVQLLYYNIAINNKTDGTQYYTNVVELYRIWYEKQRMNREKCIQSGRVVSKGKSVESY